MARRVYWISNIPSERKQRVHVAVYEALYRGAEKSLARPTSQRILFDGENISFDASLVIYLNSTNIPPIVIINRIYENQNILSLYLFFLSGRAKDLSAPLRIFRLMLVLLYI